MIRRSTSKRVTQNQELGVGNLDAVPYKYAEARCGSKKCGREFYIGSRPSCDCAERHKFKAQTCHLAGRFFGSLKEARRFSKLAFIEESRIILSLVTQPAYTLTVNGSKICQVRFDFGYYYGGTWILEDTKGAMTPLGKFKLKIFEALYPEKKVVIL